MKEFKADDDARIIAVASSAIALAAAEPDGTIMLIYREKRIKVRSSDSVNKIFTHWNKIKDEIDD